MNDVVYQQVRSEMTAIYTSFRQLQMSQYVVITALITTILSFSKTEGIQVSLGAGAALSGLLIAVTWIGAQWYSSATRLGAYLLVVWEIPLLDDKNKKDVTKKHLWILANRSESFKNFKISYPNKHSFGSGIKRFYYHQSLLAIFGLCVTGIALWPLWVDFGTPQKVIMMFDLFLFLVTIIWGICKGSKPETGDPQIQAWNEYLKDRKNHDNRYLQYVGIQQPNKSLNPTA